MPDNLAMQPDLRTESSGSECDVVVIGGGPGGSTIAALLAERGRDVVVLEKDQHPRFHIGESLLPANLPLFKRLGLSDAVHQIGLFKPGAEFVSDRYSKSNLFFFANATHLISTHSYQVRRASFDQLLFENCRRKGARAYERARVMDVAFKGDDRPVVTANHDGETVTWRPRFVVDASGRDTFIAGKLGHKTVNKRNNSAAIFGHFADVPRRDGAAEGVITIHLVDDGWFWMIPLPDGLMSVGLVGNPSLFKNRQGSIEELFWKSVRASPSVADRMASAKLTAPLTTTGNYSYTARTAGGERYLLIGDAFTFIDPIFSSGVMIAMSTGVLGADAVDLFLSDERRGQRAIRAFERKFRRATAALSWLIYRINSPAFRHMLMHPSNHFRMRDGLISLLAGEIFRRSLSTRVSVMMFKLTYGLLVLRDRMQPPRQDDDALRPQSAGQAD